MMATASTTTWRLERLVGMPACGQASSSVRTAGLPAFPASLGFLGAEGIQLDVNVYGEKQAHNPVGAAST